MTQQRAANTRGFYALRSATHQRNAPCAHDRLHELSPLFVEIELDAARAQLQLFIDYERLFPALDAQSIAPERAADLDLFGRRVPSAAARCLDLPDRLLGRNDSELDVD